MAGPLLYQPRQRWRVGVAFGAAVCLHFAAVALAGRYGNTPTEHFIPGPDKFPPLVFFDPSPATDEPTPPPEDVSAPSPIPNPVDEPIFPENRSTPPPVRQTTRLVAPIVRVRSTVTSGPVGFSQARVMAVSAPRPEYPYEARRQKIVGSGVIAMTVDPVSGSVSHAVMEQSTGSPVLDNAAVTAFRRWRFKPGTVSRVRAPVTFTMTGAQY